MASLVSLKGDIHILAMAPAPATLASPCSEMYGWSTQLRKAGWVQKNKESNNLLCQSTILGVI